MDATSPLVKAHVSQGLEVTNSILTQHIETRSRRSYQAERGRGAQPRAGDGIKKILNIGSNIKGWISDKFGAYRFLTLSKLTASKFVLSFAYVEISSGCCRSTKGMLILQPSDKCDK